MIIPEEAGLGDRSDHRSQQIIRHGKDVERGYVMSDTRTAYCFVSRLSLPLIELPFGLRRYDNSTSRLP
jgi:hypothetical protein